MRYLLFVYPHKFLGDTQDLAEEISDVLLGFTHSNSIKYTYGPKYIVIHFSVNPDHVSELEDVLTVYEEQMNVDFTYFLTQVGNGFITNLSPKIKNYLNDLENEETSKYEYESIIDDNFLSRIQEYNRVFESMESELTVDEILDKISQYGMDSLTKQELNKLNNQSKNDRKI